MNIDKNLEKLNGDASPRFFFRKKKKNISSIIIYAPKNKKSNLLIYDSINKILLKNNILAPKLLSQNYLKNYIEVTDFGNRTILSLLKEKKSNKLRIFKKVIKLLIKLQLIRQKKVKNFQNKNYKIPTYSEKILLEEAKLFSSWYVKNKLSKTKHVIFKKKFVKIIKNLIKKLYLKNNIFVHRDFHISNLMVVKNKIGVIDTQDALIGNKAYDLASLIDDVRFKTSESLKKDIFKYYLKSQKKLNKKYFKNDFEIISVLRNLKIIGIFTRLAVRDNKKKYLKLIPYTWDLIRLRSKNSENFNNLINLLYSLKIN